MLTADCEEAQWVECGRSVCYIIGMIHKFIPVLATLVLFSGCDAGGEACSGFTITGTSTQTSFSVSELMAHATAMGMTQQEAETLIYLEGITPNTRIEPGETICIDGTPNR
ncbi:MAG: hypothetical protein CVT87_00200 [Alphaproteobacteria bacterium HGW-Alphaproteobacteria-9]|nr:MAG: hypothetical protein CVT87_00200 [Alphaproteobacteria bacterium HGW-Alphaproteobacteria-9]